MTEWIGGRRPVEEALAAGRPARRLVISSHARPNPELRRLRAMAREGGVRVETAEPSRIGRLAGFEGHQGVLLEVADRRWADLTEILGHARVRGADPLVLLLEHLQDPVNLGALLRSAEAAGTDGVVFPARGAAPLGPAAVKASAGASEHLLLARVESLGDVMHDLRERGVTLVAADQDADRIAWEAELDGPLAVVVGSEGSGLSRLTRSRCDLLVRFPMAGRIGSLNAATAGALLLFEAVRQRSRRDRLVDSAAGPT